MQRSPVRAQQPAPRRRSHQRLFCRWYVRAGITLAFLLILIPVTHALALETGIDFGTATGLSTQDIRITVAKIIRAALALLGIIVLGITLYGGYLWMTAGGSDEKIIAAKQWLTNGAIGLTIILLAFSITQFVLSRLINASGGGSGTVTTAGGFGEDIFLSGALGAGPIESHYPARGAADVPRNTRIFITFRDAVAPASLAEDTNGNGTIGTTGEDPRAFDNDTDLAKPEAIQVAAVGQNVDPLKLTALARTQDPARFAAEVAKLTPVGFRIAADGRTIVLTPVAVGGDGRVRTNASGYAERSFLGNATAPTAYVVRITGAALRADGNTLFSSAFREGYSWDFAVSTVVDVTPPKVMSVMPIPDSARDAPDGTVRGQPDQPRNAIAQITFSEAMDPTVTSGMFAPNDPARPFAHLAVSSDGSDGGRLGGTFRIGNAYRTVEFTTNAACGQNSCGGTVYCLPGDALLTAWANAARLDAGGPAGIPFSGIMDAAGNSLDGDGDGRAEGPSTGAIARFHIGGLGPLNAVSSDSAQWTFATNDALDLVAPEVREITHYARQEMPLRFRSGEHRIESLENISATQPAEVLFTKLMSVALERGVLLSEASGCAESGAGCLWYAVTSAHEDTDGDRRLDATRATIAHAPFREARPGFDVPQYRVRLDADIRDLYQNCLFTVGAPPGPRGPQGGERCVGTGASEQCAAIP